MLLVRCRAGPDEPPQVEGWIYDFTANQPERLLDVGPETGSFRIAPNSRSVAYTIHGGVFLRSFPGAGTPIRVSPTSGRFPRWRADARELFYADSSGAIMAAPIRDDGTLAGPPQVAVSASAVRAGTGSPGSVNFEPSPDGQRLYVQYSVTPERATLTLLTNWWKFAGVASR